jgi:hypothetical protein
MPRIRKRITTNRQYNPVWAGPVEGYTVNFLKKNFWRVQAHMEYQDAVQEAQLLFVHLKRKYGCLDTPQHFMAIYKVSLLNEFNEIAARDGKYRKEVSDSQIHATEDFNYVETMMGVTGDTDNEGMLHIMIQQAPEEVKQVLRLFVETPIEVLEQFARVWKKKGRNMEFGNHHLCHLLKIKEGTDLVGKVRAYFQ